MTLTRFLKLVFLAIGVLYVAVSSLGQVLPWARGSWQTGISVP